MAETTAKPARLSHAGAADDLARRDPIFAALVGAAGPPRLRRPSTDGFSALARSIVSQQLATKAAAAIHGRLLVACGDDVTPDAILAMAPEEMRALGLSGNKSASLVDLATKATDGTIDLNPRRLARRTDEQIIEELTVVRGIGRWTVEMFLMFQLRRMDVWPVGDLGVRRGYGLAWKVPMPHPTELDPLGERFRPYRSIVAWYCWRACEVYGGVNRG